MVLSHRSAVITAWEEREVKVYKVRYVDPEGGKTGKGVILFWELAPWSKEFASRCGQNAAVDIEDIVLIR